MLYCTSVVNHVLYEENHSDCVSVHAYVLTGPFFFYCKLTITVCVFFPPSLTLYCLQFALIILLLIKEDFQCYLWLSSHTKRLSRNSSFLVCQYVVLWIQSQREYNISRTSPYFLSPSYKCNACIYEPTMVYSRFMLWPTRCSGKVKLGHQLIPLVASQAYNFLSLHSFFKEWPLDIKYLKEHLSSVTFIHPIRSGRRACCWPCLLNSSIWWEPRREPFLPWHPPVETSSPPPPFSFNPIVFSEML